MLLHYLDYPFHKILHILLKPSVKFVPLATFTRPAR